MKNHLFKRILSLLLVAALLAGYYVPGIQAASTGVSWKETDETVRPDMSGRKAETHVEEDYAPTDRVRVSIVLEDKPTVQAGFPTRNIGQNTQAMAYNRQLMAKQEAMAKTISAQALSGQKLDVQWNLTLVGNIISANVPYGRIDAIREVDGVIAALGACESISEAKISTIDLGTGIASAAVHPPRAVGRDPAPAWGIHREPLLKYFQRPPHPDPDSSPEYS